MEFGMRRAQKITRSFPPSGVLKFKIDGAARGKS